MHPCNAAARDTLLGVKVASYRARVDELDALRFECDGFLSGKERSPVEHDDLHMRCVGYEGAAAPSWQENLAPTFSAFPNASVVAFARHGAALRRSPPRRFRTLFDGAFGVAHTPELRLELRFKDGVLESMLWADQGCRKCEGITGAAAAGESQVCVEGNCAVLEGFCLSAATEGTDGAADCRLRVYVAWAGTDAEGVPLRSAKALAAIGSLTVSGSAIDGVIEGIDKSKELIDTVKDEVEGVINTTEDTLTGR